MIRNNENQHSDFEWYKDHLKELYDQYGECIVVIKNKKVLGTYTSFGEASRCALAYNLPGTFIIQKLGPDEDSYTTYL